MRGGDTYRQNSAWSGDGLVIAEPTIEMPLDNNPDLFANVPVPTVEFATGGLDTSNLFDGVRLVDSYGDAVRGFDARVAAGINEAVRIQDLQDLALNDPYSFSGTRAVAELTGRTPDEVLADRLTTSRTETTTGNAYALSGWESIKAFNPVVSGLSDKLAALNQAPIGLLLNGYLTARDELGLMRDAIFGSEGGESYRPITPLGQSIQEEGLMMTLGQSTVSSIKGLPPFSMLDSLNRRDWYGVGGALPDTLLAVGGSLFMANGGAATGLVTREGIISRLGETVQPHLKIIGELDADALVGFRGSLARGFKHQDKGGGPFDVNDFDVDAFIVSDKLASQYPRSAWFRDGSRIPEIGGAQSAIDQSLRSEFSGLRSDPFTFRVYTQREIQKLQLKPDEAQVFFIKGR